MAVVARLEDKRKESEKLRRPKVKWWSLRPFRGCGRAHFLLPSPLGLAAGYTSMTVMTLGGASAIMLALILNSCYGPHHFHDV